MSDGYQRPPTDEEIEIVNSARESAERAVAAFEEMRGAVARAKLAGAPQSWVDEYQQLVDAGDVLVQSMRRSGLVK